MTEEESGEEGKVPSSVAVSFSLLLPAALADGDLHVPVGSFTCSGLEFRSTSLVLRPLAKPPLHGFHCWHGGCSSCTFR